MGAVVDLSTGELEALRKAIFAAMAQPAIAEECGLRELRAVDKKLVAAIGALACWNCEERTTRRSNGLCDRCNTYATKYGEPPSSETLLKSARRQRETTKRPVSPRKATRPQSRAD